jgi:hypothetical protein
MRCRCSVNADGMIRAWVSAGIIERSHAERGNFVLFHCRKLQELTASVINFVIILLSLPAAVKFSN